MKLIVSRADLLFATDRTEATSARSTFSILEHTLVQARTGSVTLTTNNFDAAISVEIKAEVARPGDIAIKTDALRSIAHKMPEGALIEIDVVSGRAGVRAGRSHLTLPTLPAADFPVWAADENAKTFAVDAAGLRTILNRTRFAASRDETRAYLCGVHMHRAGKILRAVATDGHRLALAEIPAPDGSRDMPGAILPTALAAMLCKFLPDEDEVTVSIGERISVRFAGTTIRSRLVDGTFPIYDRSIRHDNPHVFLVDADKFRSMIERVALAVDDHDHTVSLTFGESSVLARAQGSGNGREAEEEIDARGPAHPITIGFNSRQLIEQLFELDADTIEIKLKDSETSALLIVPGREGHLHVLCQVRLKSLARAQAA